MEGALSGIALRGLAEAGLDQSGRETAFSARVTSRGRCRMIGDVAVIILAALVLAVMLWLGDELAKWVLR